MRYHTPQDEELAVGQWCLLAAEAQEKVVPWEGLSLLERQDAWFAVFICIKNALPVHCAGFCLWSVTDWSPFFPSVGNRLGQTTSSPEHKEPRGLYYKRPLHHSLSGTRGLTLPKLWSPTQAFGSQGRTHFKLCICGDIQISPLSSCCEQLL